MTTDPSNLPTPQPRLRVANLGKRYGARQALKSLSLTLAPGCFAALLGPNGAGKSTLFQVLTGLFAADEGEVWVNGCALRSDAVGALRHIGVVFQQMSLDLDLSVLRNLRFHADLHGSLGFFNQVGGPQHAAGALAHVGLQGLAQVAP